MTDRYGTLIAFWPFGVGGGDGQGHMFMSFFSTCCLPSPDVIAKFLIVDVNDSFHKQVPLQTINPMTVQYHLLSAGRTAEVSAVVCEGFASLEQRRLIQTIQMSV